MSAWAEFLATVDVSQFPLGLRFRYENGCLVTSFYAVYKWIDARPLPLPPFNAEWGRAIIRREAQLAVLHELDEVLRIGGTPVNDPHARPPLPDYRT